MKAVTTSSIPSVFVCLAIEPTPHKVIDGNGAEDYSVRRWSCTVRMNGEIKRYTSEDPATFWTMLRKLCIRKRNVWILTPSVSTSFQVMGGWILSESGEIDWGSLVDKRPKHEREKVDKFGADRCTMILSPAVSILTHKYHLGRATWVSLSNYTSAPVPSIAESVGIEARYDTDFGPAGHGWTLDSKTSAIAMGEFFRRWHDRWIESDSGHWSATAAMLSHQTFRRRFYKKDLVEHRESDCAILEREAIYTGRAEVFFFGKVDSGLSPWADWPAQLKPSHKAGKSGPVYHYDIRSQYPAIMRDCVFPVCLDREFESITLQELSARVKYRCVVARVIINTDTPIYPYRDKGHRMTSKERVGRIIKSQEDYIRAQVIYPIGRFKTSLYGPELGEALSRGHVESVIGGWEYRPGSPFEEYAGWLIDQRIQARKSGDKTAEITIKLLSNAFAGKFAARSGGWRTVTDVIPECRWGEWHHIDIDDVEPISYRAIAGVVQRYDKPDDQPKGYPSIFGYLTSYGRIQLWKCIEAAGEDNVIWANTDGLIVDEVGHLKLQSSNLVGNNEAGKLEFKDTIERFAAWGPSHYYADGEWTLAGFQSFIRFDDNGKYIEMGAPSLADLYQSHEYDTARYRWIHREMPGKPAGAGIGPTGRIVRRQLGNGKPIEQRSESAVDQGFFGLGG